MAFFLLFSHILKSMHLNASQFEEVPQSCHRFGEELPASLKKCHRAVAGLEKSHCRIGRGRWLRITGLEFPFFTINPFTFLFTLDFAEEYL
jgi:hypothetical protein